MKFGYLFLSLMLFTVAQVSDSRATDDWPAWLGEGMKGVWNESGLVEEFPEQGPPVVWRQPISIGYSGPSVIGDRIYITDWTKAESNAGDEPNKTSTLPGTERVLCLNTADGKVVWSHDYDCPYNIAYPNGPRCTPTVDADRVYTLGAMGHLICFNRNSGKVLWQKLLTDEFSTKPPFWGYSSHPVVDGDHLLMPVGGDGSAVVCFDKMTGKEIWRALTSSDVAYVPLTFFKGPESGAKRQLLFWHADGVSSLDPATGKEFWNVVWPENKQQPQATTIVTPRMQGNLFFVSEFYRGSLLLEIGSDPPSVKEIYRTFKTDPRHNESLNALMTTPIIKDGFVYGITGMGEFRCVDLMTGKAKWKKPDWLEAKPKVFATSFIVVNQDRYFMFNDNGELMIAKFSPEGFEEIDRTKILEPTFTTRGRTVVWSHPAFANGQMIARNDQEIICVDLRKSSKK